MAINENMIVTALKRMAMPVEVLTTQCWEMLISLLLLSPPFHFFLLFLLFLFLLSFLLFRMWREHGVSVNVHLALSLFKWSSSFSRFFSPFFSFPFFTSAQKIIITIWLLFQLFFISPLVSCPICSICLCLDPPYCLFILQCFPSCLLCPIFSCPIYSLSLHLVYSSFNAACVSLPFPSLETDSQVGCFQIVAANLASTSNHLTFRISHSRLRFWFLSISEWDCWK